MSVHLHVCLLHQNQQNMLLFQNRQMSTKTIWVQKKVNGKDEGDEVEIEIDVKNGNVFQLIKMSRDLLTKDIPIADMFLMVDNVTYKNKTRLNEIENLRGDDVPTVFICWNKENQQVKDNPKGTKIDVCVCICNIHNCYTLHFSCIYYTTRDIRT